MGARLRVVHCGTAAIGYHALRGILAHPDLELVGLLAASPDKLGRDAGGIAGQAPIGIYATDDIDALCALDADCLSYFAGAVGREADATEQLAAFLARGTNVVSTSFFSLIDPLSSPERDVIDVLSAACIAGGATVFNSGIEPGFATVHLPAALLSLCAEVKSMRITEFFNYGHYPNPLVIRDMFGFGMPPDHVPSLFVRGGMGSYDKLWGPSITLLARQLGVGIDELRLEHEFWIADEAFDMASTRVEAGTIGGVRFEVQGMVDGRPLIVVEHVNYGSTTAPPHWERPPTGDGTYRIEISGKPDLTTTMAFAGTEDRAISGRIATAMHAINAIPAVCAAPAGLVSIADLPLYTSRAICT